MTSRLVVKAVAHVLGHARENEERRQMLDQLVEDGAEGAADLRGALDAWFDDAKAAAGQAPTVAAAALVLERRVPDLLLLLKHLAHECKPILGMIDRVPEGGFWWYADEVAAAAAEGGGSDHEEGRVLQILNYFGLHDLLCDLVCLAALDESHAKILSAERCDYEPFLAVVFAQDAALVSRLDVAGSALGASTCLSYLAAAGFASKVLPDALTRDDAFAGGYNEPGLVEGGGCPLHVLVGEEDHARSTQDSWAACAACAVVVQLGGKLAAPHRETFSTPLQMASAVDSVLFMYFMHTIATAAATTTQPTLGGAGEEKEAATKAEVQALREELMETRRQFGSILLLFGKLLGARGSGGGGGGGGGGMAPAKVVAAAPQPAAASVAPSEVSLVSDAPSPAGARRAGADDRSSANSEPSTRGGGEAESSSDDDEIAMA